MLQLRSLAHLVALSRRLNFARAAEDLGISQSALSRSIQALEQQLGMRLFDRDRVGVGPTPQGQLAIERARVLLAEAADLERELVQSASARSGRIRFGMAPMPARALLPAAMAARLRVAPEVTHEVVVRDADALWTLLVAGEIEFFVSNEGFAFESPPPRIETLAQFPIGAVVRAGHPLLSGECPGAKFPVVRASWTGLPLPLDIQARMNGAPNIIEDFGALATITATSDAIWFSSTYSVRDELRSGQLCALPNTTAFSGGVRVAIYSLQRRSQSPLARALKQELRHQANALAGSG